MRQPRLRKAGSLAAGMGALILLAACGQVKAGSAGAPSSTSPTPSGSLTACVSAPLSGSPRVATLGDSDNGKVLCVKVGTGVLVYLHGSLARKWSTIQSSSADLTPRANGRMMLAIGVTGGYFVATHPGTATITSSRNGCGPEAQPTAPTTPTAPTAPTTPTTPSAQHCSSIGTVYHVTLVITG